MNQVKNMSLNGVHADVHTYDVNQVEREYRVSDWRSVMIKESAEDASIGNRGTDRLSETNGRAVAADEVDSNNDEVST